MFVGTPWAGLFTTIGAAHEIVRLRDEHVLVWHRENGKFRVSSST